MSIVNKLVDMVRQGVQWENPSGQPFSEKMKYFSLLSVWMRDEEGREWRGVPIEFRNSAEWVLVRSVGQKNRRSLGVGIGSGNAT